MTILVCPLSQAARLVAARAPERIVSLLDPGARFPEAGRAYADLHLRLRLHDIPAPIVGMVAPSARHIDELLAFLRGWTRRSPILIHCHAGYSRSTATAFITACLHNPRTSEREIAQALRRASPCARPNIGLIQLADTAMKREGRMIASATEIARDWCPPECEENEPFELPGVFPASIPAIGSLPTRA